MSGQRNQAGKLGFGRPIGLFQDGGWRVFTTFARFTNDKIS